MNTHGETPLFHAIMHSNLAVVDALIERKASFNLANKCVALFNSPHTTSTRLLTRPLRNYRAGATPLHFAVLAQKPDIVRRLIDLGVSPHIGTDQRYTCVPRPRLCRVSCVIRARQGSVALILITR